MKKWKLIEINKVVEADGSLVVTEVNNRVPFEIKRIFFVKDVAEGASRGNHATKKTKLILFPISGSCWIHVDDGEKSEEIFMDRDTQGLYIDEMVWRSMYDFSSDCIMVAVCNRNYEKGNETYEDYSEYIEAVKRYDE